jgi:hypothetical protein
MSGETHRLGREIYTVLAAWDDAGPDFRVDWLGHPARELDGCRLSRSLVLRTAATGQGPGRAGHRMEELAACCRSAASTVAGAELPADLRADSAAAAAAMAPPEDPLSSWFHAIADAGSIPAVSTIRPGEAARLSGFSPR